MYPLGVDVQTDRIAHPPGHRAFGHHALTADLAGYMSRRAAGGCTVANIADEPGVRFYRITQSMRCHKGHAFGPRLSIVGQGRKIARFAAQSFDYDPMRYLVITGEAEFDAEVVGASDEQPYLEASIDLPAELVLKTLLAMANGEGEIAALPEPAPQAYVAELDHAIADAVARLFVALENPTERRILAPLALEELVFHLLRTPAAAVLRLATSARDAEPIFQAMNFMRTHAARPLSVQEVARSVGMSASHFAHRFRSVARTSPMRYLKQLRMNAARDLLLAGDRRVAEAASHVGYQSASHFTRDFKLAFNASPAEYVRRFRDR